MSDKKKMPQILPQTRRGHSTMMAILGTYLLYIGYQLVDGALHGDESMPVWLSFVFAGLFVAAGVGVLVMGYRMYNEAKRKEKELEEQEKLEAAQEKKEQE